MNSQELYLDIASGRFLDGNSSIPVASPIIYSDEQKAFNINLYKITKNEITSVSPSANSRFKARLGTVTQKLADGQDVSTAPISTIRALGTIITKPSSSAIGSGSLFLYSPVTASLTSNITTFPVVTGLFNISVDYLAPVTATITASYSGATTATITKPLQLVSTQIGNSFFLNNTQKPIDISQSLNSPVTATFTAEILSGEVVNIKITQPGRGYPNGTYALSFGAAVTPSSTASVNVVASGGSIQTFTIVSGGIGYVAAPTVTLFCPAKSLAYVGTTFVDLGVKGVNTDQTMLSFSPPDAPLDLATQKTPSAYLKYAGVDTKWELTVTEPGYGYSQKPSVSHGDILAYLPIIYYLPSVVSGPLFASGYIKNESLGGCDTALFKLNRVVTFSSIPQKIELGGLNLAPAYLSHKWISGSKNEISFPSLSLSYNNQVRVSGSIPANNKYLDDISANFGAKAAYLLSTIGSIVTGSKFGPSNKIYTPPTSLATVGDGAITIDAYKQISGSGVKAVVTGMIISSLFTNENKSDQVGGLLSAKHDIYAGKKCLVAIIPSDRSFVPTQYAVAEIECPIIDNSYVIGGSTSDGVEIKTDFGGGRFTPIFKVLSVGSGYNVNYKGSYDLIELGSLYSNNFLIESSLPITYNIPQSEADGYIETAYSYPITVATRAGQSSVQYFIANGGIGYFSNTAVGLISTQTAGFLKTVSLTNSPKSYSDGEYDCDVSAPASGTKAKVKLKVNNGNYYPVILSGGSGYTSAPIVTAPPPNFISGQVIGVSVLSKPQGYSQKTKFYLSIPESSVTGGKAEISFSIDEKENIETSIINNGFGYTQGFVATAPTPDLKNTNGYIQSIQINNSPDGYIIGQPYDLQIEPSPQSGGNAFAQIIKESASAYKINILNQGAGYTSPPVVTAPGPNAPNGLLSSIVIVTSGYGYAPGTYQATVTTAPSSGRTAKANFIVTDSLDCKFEVIDSGEGYSSNPQITVPTPSGAVIQSITISCAGSYYNYSNVDVSITDKSGVGVQLDAPTIKNGGISSINVLNGGYGYSNNPTLLFNKPPVPATVFPDVNQIQTYFNITAASANSILLTDTSKNILMEIYETDDVKEQVLTQANVTLAKRVAS